MRKSISLISLAVSAVLLTGCDPGSSTEETGRVTAENAGDVLIIPVEGMVCMACVSRVNRTLTRIEGIDFAEADLAARQVRVRSDETAVTREEIIKAIHEMGYKPGEPVEPEEGN